jgi:ketosteroid isomerase-like protein
MTPEAERLRAGNEAVVRRMVAALEAADPVAIAALLADDVVYHFPGRSSLAGTYRGRDEVMGVFRGLGALLGGPPKLRSHDVVASEAHVVELATHSAARGGAPFEWQALRVYHFGEGGLISEVWLTIPDLYAFDAYLE